MAIPKILNNDPLTTPVPLDAPYYAYYFNGNSMGRFDHKNQLIFKFIGYNEGAPDPYSDDITYSYGGNYVDAFDVPTPPTPSDPANTTNGWLNGTIKDIGDTIITYTIEVTATTAQGSTTKIFTFTVVGGTGTDIIDDSVEWDTLPDLGTIDNGAISEFSIRATFGDGHGEYKVVGGNLPPGLELLTNGDISGRVEFNLNSSDSPYIFTVEAYDSRYPTLITTTRDFSITVIQKYSKPYDTVYMPGLLSQRDRLSVNSLLNSIKTTQLSKIYRPTDRFFGVADELVYQHQFGVHTVSATSLADPNYFYNEYTEAIKQNFYWKFLTLGPLKTAVATDELGNVIYEVVYCQIIDDLVNAKGQSISKKVGFRTPITTNIGPYWTSSTDIYTSNTYYDTQPIVKSVASAITSSFTIVLNNTENLFVGMQVTSSPAGIIVNDANDIPPSIQEITSNTVRLNVQQTLNARQQIFFNAPITTSNGVTSENIELYPNSLQNMREQIADSLGQYTDSELLPRWMNTEQSDGNILGYVPCWVLCYTLPGKSGEVLESIRTYLRSANLTLNQITFQIDRITVDRSLTSTYGINTFDQWPTQPSTSVDNDSQDSYINFPKKTILY